MNRSALNLFFQKQRVVASQVQVPEVSSCLTSVFGQTGSGKSTLIGYLMGHDKMEYTRIGQNQYHVSHPTTDLLPEIGNSYNSQTELPAIYKEGESNYVDLPGIFDTKGTEQELLNAYANSLIFRKDSIFKFLIVISHDSLAQGRGKTFVNVICRMEALLGEDFPQIARSCCIIISKTNTQLQTEDSIKEKISSIIRIHHNMDQNSDRHKFVQQIIHRQQLILFPYPKNITPQIINKIKTKIKKLRLHTLNSNSMLSLSGESISLLSSQIRIRMDQIRQNLEGIVKRIKNTYQKPYHNHVTASTNKRKLERAEQEKDQVHLLGVKHPLEQLLHGILLDDLRQTRNIQEISSQLQQLEHIYPQATEGYPDQFDVLFYEIQKSKDHAAKQIQRIEHEKEMERIRQQAEEQQRQQIIRQQIEMQRIREAQERRQAYERQRQYEREQRRYRQLDALQRQQQAQRHQMWEELQRQRVLAERQRLIRLFLFRWSLYFR